MKSVRLRLFGTVQGVGLRYRCKWKADELDLNGSVHNEPDGSVTVLLSGMDYKIEAFRTWLLSGVGSATISRVEVTPASGGEAQGFQII